MGEQIATYWKAVGISMDTVLLDRPALLAMRNAKKMKGAVFVEMVTHPSIGARLSYSFGSEILRKLPGYSSLMGGIQ